MVDTGAATGTDTASDAAGGALNGTSGRSGALWWIALLALALRVVEAVESSLWLDELHTLSHASQPTLGAVIESVQSEFHTPLFFAFVHLFGGFEAGAWLRVVPILSSVALLWPLCTLARQCGLSARATLAMAWLYACLPYQILYGSELRPYAWVLCFSVLAFALALSEQRSVLVRLAWFALAILLGLLTHRLMALTLFSIGAARLFIRKPRAVPLWGLILSGAIALAGFLPWLLGFAVQATEARFEYQESVGGYHLRPTLVKELLALPARVVAPFMGELGGNWKALEVVSCIAFAIAALAIAVLGWRNSKLRPPEPALRGLAIFAAVQFVITTIFAVWTWDRVPLQYYTPMAWTIPVLLAAAWDRIEAAPARRGLGVALAVSSLLMGIGLVGGRSREDMRAGIAAVRAMAEEARAVTGREPIFTALLAQPPQFAHTLPYRAYAADLAALEPAAVPGPSDQGFDRPVIVLRRAIGMGHEKWAPITSGRAQIRSVSIDRYLTVYWFSPADSALSR